MRTSIVFAAGVSLAAAAAVPKSHSTSSVALPGFSLPPFTLPPFTLPPFTFPSPSPSVPTATPTSVSIPTGVPTISIPGTTPTGGSSSDPDAPCASQPAGYGPPSFPPTDAGFLANPTYNVSATQANTPTNYTSVFRGATGSSQQDGYLSQYLLQSYDVSHCASLCTGWAASNGNGNSLPCQSFNIFFERDPVVNPAPACPNPAPTTYIKCALFSTLLSNTTATNLGQYREQFHVVVAGSDGFNRVQTNPWW